MESLYGVSKIVYDTELPMYSLGFSVVSNSINEAIENHGKMQTLFRMVYPEHVPSGLIETIYSKVYVKVSNLMSFESVFGAHSKGGTGGVESQGISCNCTKI